jgi:hypothetical protein
MDGDPAQKEQPRGQQAKRRARKAHRNKPRNSRRAFVDFKTSLSGMARDVDCHDATFTFARLSLLSNSMPVWLSPGGNGRQQSSIFDFRLEDDAGQNLTPVGNRHI